MIMLKVSYDSPQKSIMGNSRIDILKMDPVKYKLNLLTRQECGGPERTAQEWARDFKQVATINTGMFMQDQRSCGYMKNFKVVINSHVSVSNTILAFNPIDGSVPPVQIIDRQCQDWGDLQYRYECYDQSIRMVDCNQVNCWKDMDKRWSVACIGIDKSGNVLFIFCRSPYKMHDFIDILLKAPIELYNLMYLEGGPPASFYLNSGNREVSGIGSYESDVCETDENSVFWNVPNVIGIEKIEGI
jgi:hypothetical protein